MFKKLIRLILLSVLGFAGFWYCYQAGIFTRDPLPLIAAPGQEEGALLEEQIVSYRSMRYVLLKPIGYDESKEYPLVVCFHPGCPTTRVSQEHVPVTHCLYKMDYDFVKENPCFILIPQASRLWWEHGKSGSLLTEVRSYIDHHLMNELPIDSSRLYTIGFSDGGTGILHMLAWNPDYFAAAIPVAGWIAPGNQDRGVMENMVRSKTAVWMFSGAKDNCADWSIMKQLPEWFEKHKGNMKLTLSDGGHGAPLQAYNTLCAGKKTKDAQFKALGPACDTSTSNPLEWLFKQRLD